MQYRRYNSVQLWRFNKKTGKAPFFRRSCKLQYDDGARTAAVYAPGNAFFKIFLFVLSDVFFVHDRTDFHIEQNSACLQTGNDRHPGIGIEAFVYDIFFDFFFARLVAIFYRAVSDRRFSNCKTIRKQ